MHASLARRARYQATKKPRIPRSPTRKREVSILGIRIPVKRWSSFPETPFAIKVHSLSTRLSVCLYVMFSRTRVSPFLLQLRCWDLGSKCSARLETSRANLESVFRARCTASRNCLLPSSSKYPKLPQKQNAASNVSVQGRYLSCPTREAQDQDSLLARWIAPL